jgi:hypothetical protein
MATNRELPADSAAISCSRCTASAWSGRSSVVTAVRAFSGATISTRSRACAGSTCHPAGRTVVSSDVSLTSVSAARALSGPTTPSSPASTPIPIDCFNLRSTVAFLSPTRSSKRPATLLGGVTFRSVGFARG